MLLNLLVLLGLGCEGVDLAPQGTVLHVHLGRGRVAGDFVHREHILQQLDQFLLLLEHRPVVHRRLLVLRDRRVEFLNAATINGVSITVGFLL